MKTDADVRWERRQLAAARRRDLRKRAVEYKGGKCEICQYGKTPAAMDFHHRDPQGKDFSISDRMSSWAAIRDELDKCVLLCSRCHREVHEGWHPLYLTLDGADRGGGSFEDDPLLDEEELPEDELQGEPSEVMGFVGAGLFDS